MRTGRGWAGWLGVLYALSMPATARAGPVEVLVQALLHPAQPDAIALRYENGGGGLLISRDGGVSFELLCSAALGLDRERPSTSMLNIDGQLMVSTFRGLRRSEHDACGFRSESAFDGLWVTDLALDPRDPAVMYAVPVARRA
jgi:hypothetical protein